MTSRTEAGVRYLFVVARKNPDLFARVRDRLHGDPRIDVITDRRYGERRRTEMPHEGERRTRERRRPTNIWNDLTIYPTLVAQRHVDSYAELEEKLANAAREMGTLAVENEHQRETIRGLERRIEALTDDDERLRADNERLHNEIEGLRRRLGAQAAADAEFKADLAALLSQAEQTLGELITSFRRIARDPGQPEQHEPRLRSV